MATKYLKNSAGDIIEGVTVSTSAGSGSADKIPSLDATGMLDVSMLPGLPIAVNNDTGVTTTLATLFTVALPAAGRYRVRMQVRYRGLSGTGFQTITLSAAHSSLTELMGSWTRSRRNQTVDTGAIYGGTTFVASRGAAIGDVHAIEFLGHIIVSASGSLTVKTQLDAGTGNVLAGSMVQVIPESTSTTLQGYTNYVTITSGSGYAGSVLTSTNAGQWKADGTNISGQTGSTYTVTRDVEGKAITCGTSSNAIQMWTPLHLPTAFKTDGTNFGGWWDPSDSASVTLNGGNISSIANQFTGGPAMVQASAGLQPPLTSGYIAFPNSNQSVGYGLGAASDVLVRHMVICAAYTPSTWAGSVRIYNVAGGGPPRLIGGENQSLLVVSAGAGVNNMAFVGSQDCAPPSSGFNLNNKLSLWEFSVPYTLAQGGPFSDFATANWRGRWSDWLYLAATPSSAQLERIQGYVMWHNGIQTSLPPDHPYYAAPPRVS